MRASSSFIVGSTSSQPSGGGAERDVRTFGMAGKKSKPTKAREEEV